MSKLDEQVKILHFPEMGDERGTLVVIEGGEAIPFEIRRVFYMYGSDPEIRRGCHSNKRSEFVLVNVAGFSRILVDNGEEKRVVELDKPRMGLYIKNNVWKEMYDFSPDSVLLVLSNEHYDGEEYIRDYGEYLDYLNRLKSTGDRA